MTVMVELVLSFVSVEGVHTEWACRDTPVALAARLQKYIEGVQKQERCAQFTATIHPLATCEHMACETIEAKR